jgi:hypothetical protein
MHIALPVLQKKKHARATESINNDKLVLLCLADNGKRKKGKKKKEVKRQMKTLEWKCKSW